MRPCLYIQVPCSSPQEASFLGKTPPVQGRACFTDRSTFHPQGRPLPEMEQIRKVYQVSDTSSLAAGSQHQQPTSLAVPQLHAASSEATVPPSYVDPLEQIALVPPKESLCLKSITLALHVPVKNRLHREERTCGHSALSHNHPVCTAKQGTG